MAGFNEPYVLLFVLVVPLLYYIHLKITKKRRYHALKFSKVSFVKSALEGKKLKRPKIILFLTLLTISLMIIGFARPHIPLKQAKEGVNVVLVMDVSGSMKAEDYKPNRLESAKRSAKTLLESLEPKDHAGIIVFESGATTAAYLSPFKEKVIEKLSNIQPREGKTAIGDGLSLGIDMATSIPNKKKVVILLSDGVNNAGVISPNEAIAFAQVNDIEVHTIGMGSQDRVVLGYDWFGNPSYAELDEALLEQIAYSTGGEYFKSVDDQTLDKIYESIGDEIERETEQTDITLWFFGASLALMLVNFYMRYGPKRIIQ